MRDIKNVFIFCLMLVLTTCSFQTFAEEGDPASDQQLIAWMKELQPLQKVHYSWALDIHKYPQELMYEYVRLTHAVTLSAEEHHSKGKDITADVFDQAVQLCKKVNATKPKISASIGVLYPVWIWHYKGPSPTNTGEKHKAELNLLKSRLKRIQNDVTAANHKHSTDIAVTAIFLDCEAFFTRQDNAEWNAAMLAKHNATYDIAWKAFPNARIEWYSRGGVQPYDSATGWRVRPFFTLKEKGKSFSCNLNRVPEIGITRETFRRTFKLARKHGVSEVTPWISLASGNQRQPHKFEKWTFNWN
ncbi:hypothetical protein ACFLS1_09125 [Verrucomicrobiota bacterium]